MGLLSDISNIFFNTVGIGYQASKDSGLTGAEREANAFTAEQASISRNFEAQQAEIARDWQEQQYLQYNSPAAMIRQYQEAGLNPALMYGSSSGSSASMSTSIPGSPSGSSVSPHGAGDVASMVANLSMLKAQIENIKADTENKRAAAGESGARTNLLNIDASFESLLKSAELGKLGVETEKLSTDIQLIQSNIGKNKAEVNLFETQNAVNRVQLDILKIDKEYKPDIYKHQLSKGKVDIEQAKLLCSKLILEQSLIEAQTQGVQVNNQLTSQKVQTEIWNTDVTKNQRFLQDRQGDLLSMQKTLVEYQGKEVKAKTVMAEWVNTYTEKYGHQPDASTYSWIARYFGSPEN